MKITDIMKQKKVTVSCELFPPKQGSELPAAKQVVSEIAGLSPSFMSVTYRAGGETQTVAIADEIQNVNNITALAHLTCIGLKKSEIGNILSELKEKKIENILALRGDLPQGAALESNDYKNASQLMRDIVEEGGFCIGGACYPEGHPESESWEKDIEYLKIKADSGCGFFVTQMFFDNNILYNFLYRLLKRGVNIPVAAGIMPVVNGKQIARICALSGTAIPPRFKAIVDKFGDDPNAMKQAGIAYATEQIIDLIANGVTNIHIYTMNRPEIAESIMKNLSYIFK